MSHREPIRPRAARLALALLVLLGTAARAHAVQITVTTTEDEVTNDGDCSLREAFRAANSNAARDACPAGSNTNTDEIVLAADALYALTTPGADSLGLLGSLLVTDGSAAIDLEITVAGNGSATISQDAVPDTRVLSVGAHLKVEDVVIQGGTTLEKGGGIFVGAGAQLDLTRCVVRDNSAVENGGGIRNNGGTLVIQDSVLDNNSTAIAGGALSNGSNTVTIIQNTLFANNVSTAPLGNGGAIDSADQISVVGSTFVNNRAGLGGAISHFHDVAGEASISQSCFIGNDGDFTGNAVDVFNGSQPLNAAGNWWGATDGPSGVASGNGDGVSNLVSFSPASNVIHPECRPLEMVANGGFESDGDGDGIPQRWTPTLLTGADGRTCSGSGACVFKIRGNSALKRLEHSIRVEGQAGDAFLFKARSRAKDVPATGGAYRAQVTILHVDGSQQTTTLNFSTGKHGFERLSQPVTASEDYDEIQVRVEYGKASGLVRFDSVSLVTDE